MRPAPLVIFAIRLQDKPGSTLRMSAGTADEILAKHARQVAQFHEKRWAEHIRIAERD